MAPSSETRRGPRQSGPRAPSTSMERTLVIIKPDAVQRGLIGEVVGRLECKGLKLVALKMLQVSEAQARALYRVHEGNRFYEPLLRFIRSAPVVVAALEGKGACAVVRRVVGATNSAEAEPGSIRGDLGVSHRFNLVHASDAPETAREELALFFQPEEFLTYERALEGWFYDYSTGEVI